MGWLSNTLKKVTSTVSSYIGKEEQLPSPASISQRNLNKLANYASSDAEHKIARIASEVYSLVGKVGGYSSMLEANGQLGRRVDNILQSYNYTLSADFSRKLSEVLDNSAVVKTIQEHTVGYVSPQALAPAGKLLSMNNVRRVAAAASILAGMSLSNCASESTTPKPPRIGENPSVVYLPKPKAANHQSPEEVSYNLEKYIDEPVAPPKPGTSVWDSHNLLENLVYDGDDGMDPEAKKVIESWSPSERTANLRSFRRIYVKEKNASEIWSQDLANIERIEREVGGIGKASRVYDALVIDEAKNVKTPTVQSSPFLSQTPEPVIDTYVPKVGAPLPAPVAPITLDEVLPEPSTGAFLPPPLSFDEHLPEFRVGTPLPPPTTNRFVADEPLPEPSIGAPLPAPVVSRIDNYEPLPEFKVGIPIPAPKTSSSSGLGRKVVIWDLEYFVDSEGTVRRPDGSINSNLTKIYSGK
jgi:hypothetical protein